MGVKRWKKFRYKGLLLIFSVFIGISVILFIERSGIHYTVSNLDHAYIEKEKSVRAEQVHSSLSKTCLLLTDSQNSSSNVATKEMEHILLDMKVGYELADIANLSDCGFQNFETVVVALPDVSPMGEKILELADWVKNGGSVMLAMPLERESYSILLNPKLGIISSEYQNVVVESIYPEETFMIGGGRSYPISDPFESSWSVELSDNVKVHAWSGDEKKVPLIWESPYGKGKFIVVNLGYYEKSMRGFYAASYSLLTDCVAYPVINGSVFYLDDFPSPVPSGNGIYIRRDYGLSIEDFYVKVWWPDMLNLASRYDIKYTGVLIENYEDVTTGEVKKQEDVQRYQYFGNMLLRQGGEIGYHGYNHQPLCLSNTDYQTLLPYKTWTNESAMKSTMKELTRFTEEMFPEIQKSVYVPPSNILSAEGRKMLTEDIPEIRTIASHYLADKFVYQQEFEVAEDGIVEQPRITSGCLIDDYMMLTALSELNMHFVNSHFIHPDDLLDEQRGAQLGWESLKENLDDYMQWLYTSAPQIDPLTGSQLSGRIQRFAAVSAEKDITEDEILFRIQNLYDSAYFIVRFNEGEPENITGGTLDHLTGNLYLLRADTEEVRVRMRR